MKSQKLLSKEAQKADEYAAPPRHIIKKEQADMGKLKKKRMGLGGGHPMTSLAADNFERDDGFCKTAF